MIASDGVGGWENVEILRGAERCDFVIWCYVGVFSPSAMMIRVEHCITTTKHAEWVCSCEWVGRFIQEGLRIGILSGIKFSDVNSTQIFICYFILWRSVRDKISWQEVVQVEGSKGSVRIVFEVKSINSLEWFFISFFNAFFTIILITTLSLSTPRCSII